MGVTWASSNSSLKRIFLKVLSNVTYSPSHRQTGAPAINIQSTLRIAPDLCKNVYLTCYLVATVIHIQSVLSQTCVYTDIPGCWQVLGPTRKETTSEACQGRARFQQHRDASCHQVSFSCMARRRRKFTAF